MKASTLCLSGSLLLIATCVLAVAGERQPELGNVKWSRDLDAALAKAKQEGKPVFVLFQEVPGCAGCRQFGQEVLGNPRLVKLIESEFVPVAIFNNQPGKDREILRRYKEPAWNYQVVRFLDAKGTDLIPRKDRVWSTAGIAGRMIRALEAAGRPVPKALRQLAADGGRAGATGLTSWRYTAGPAPPGAEAKPGARPKVGAFAMFCFWDGEAKLGGLEGVLNTEAGWLEGREVVQVTYDPSVLEWADLVRAAEKVDCAHRIYAPGGSELATARQLSPRTAKLYQADTYRKAKESDQKRVLRASALRELQLSPLQATKVNAALRFGGWAEIRKWLSPEQQAQARRLAGN